MSRAVFGPGAKPPECKNAGTEDRPAHSRRVTPKAKKAWGVYDTPAHIVDYIVKHTVGRLLEGMTPKDLGPKQRPERKRRVKQVPKGQRRAETSAPRTLRICDPGCGSGLFLLGAYASLLAWHRDWYVRQLTPSPSTGEGRGEGAAPATPRRQNAFTDRICQGRGGEWRLTLREKKRILLNHIYGVDIDPQAVEVTKLSLLIKMFENESSETVGRTLRLFHERALPDLAGNIKCGNALIGPDFYDNPPMNQLDEEKRRRINAFDWHAEFPEVFEPARAREEAAQRCRTPLPDGRGSDQAAAAGFDAVIGNPPYLSYSGRQAVGLSEGERSYFSRNYRVAGWMTSHGLFIERAVKCLSRRFTAFIVPDQVGHLHGYESVRNTVHRYSGLVEVRYWGEAVFEGVMTPALTFISEKSHRGKVAIRRPDGSRVEAALQNGEPWTAGQCDDVFRKLRTHARSLGPLVADPGVHTGNCSKRLILPADEAGPGCVPVLEGRQVSRYRCDPPTKVLKLDYRAETGEYFTIRPNNRYADAAFVIRQTAPFPIVGPRKHADYFRNSLLSLYSPTDGTDIRYVVGILNSRLMRFVYSQLVRESRQKAFPQVKVRSLRELPIRRMDPADPNAKMRHDELVRLVEQMLVLNDAPGASQTTHRKAALQRPIDATDRRINRLVYELYELTEDEIALVEEATQ